MAIRADIEEFLPWTAGVEDSDLRDVTAHEARRPGWYALIVILDVLAVLAFVAWVVVPRLI